MVNAGKMDVKLAIGKCHFSVVDDLIINVDLDLSR